MLAVLCFRAARIFDEPFHDVPVHQRLAAEEIDFEIAPRTGMFDQKIERPFADLERHHRAFAAVLALTRKAVRAVEVARMRDMQAQRLDDAGRTRFERAGHRLECIGGKKLTRIPKLFDLRITRLQLFGRHVRVERVFFAECAQQRFFIRRFKPRDHAVCRVVHGMHRAGANVQHDIVPAEFVCMDHGVLLFELVLCFILFYYIPSAEKNKRQTASQSQRIMQKNPIRCT